MGLLLDEVNKIEAEEVAQYSSPRSGCIISGHKLPSATQRVVHFSLVSRESGDEANLGVFVSTHLFRQKSELALQLPLDRV